MRARIEKLTNSKQFNPTGTSPTETPNTPENTTKSDERHRLTEKGYRYVYLQID